MENYEFTLTFSLQNTDEDPSIHEKALWDNGCDDALIGIGKKGSIALMFDRQAESAQAAISSAVSAVMLSISGATLVEAAPDLVGFTDIAETVGCSRQNIRKLFLATSSSCPHPSYSHGNPALWHLADVLLWLQQNKGYSIHPAFIDIATITKSLNTLINWRQLTPEQRQQAEAIVTQPLAKRKIVAV